MPANFSTTAKKPKNSPDRSRGIRLANRERLSAWVPPWTIPTNPASTEKCTAGGHAVAEHADPDVDARAHEDQRFGSKSVCERAEEKRERDADELHDEDRGDQLRSARSRVSVAVDGRHLLDGADAVVVDQEGEQHQERLPVEAEVPEASRADARSRPDRVLALTFVRIEPHGGLGHASEELDREDGHQTATETRARREGRVA